MVKAQQSHLLVCGKHNGQMHLYVQKWESLKVYLKLLNLKLLDFQGCSHCHCFFSLVPIHSMSHTYIDALCSILSNFSLHFTRPGPYYILPLVLAGKQKGYDYPTFLTCYRHSIMMAHIITLPLPHNLPMCLIAD